MFRQDPSYFFYTDRSDDGQPNCLVQHVALLQCQPCNESETTATATTMSLDNASCLTDDYSTVDDIDTSFSSRSSNSPMAKALDDLSRMEDMPPVTIQTPKITNSKKKKQRGRGQAIATPRAGYPTPTFNTMATPGADVCRFFRSKKGCRAGRNCPYRHV